MTPLWDPIFGTEAIAAELSDAAWIRAMLDTEAALAKACAAAGVIDDAGPVVAACANLRIDPADLGRRAAAAGNPVVPLVGDIAHATGDASAVHRGATSQDILDTAAMLVTQRASAIILVDLRAVADTTAALARAHRDTPMAGRTLLQQALPTTFGAVAAGWLSGVDNAVARLTEVRRRLSVQLGGAAGTLAALHPHGLTVLAAFADEVGLAEPDMVWHTERTRIAELAGALGMACGAVAKVATDIVLLAQTEVGELSERESGGSSTLPHKQNPIAAVTARAAAAQAPGLVATLLAAMPAEHQRGGGAWHAEWEPLAALLRVTGGAAARLRQSLDGLHIDAARMRANLDLTHGLILAERVSAALAPKIGRAAAHELVREATLRAQRDGVEFAEALPDVDTELLDPAGYLGHAADLVDRVLERRKRQ